MGDKADFLPADKDESFLQDDSITLGVRSQACLKYPKQQVCNIFAISQGKGIYLREYLKEYLKVPKIGIW